jgi:hypothetical protein
VNVNIRSQPLIDGMLALEAPFALVLAAVRHASDKTMERHKKSNLGDRTSHSPLDWDKSELVRN